MNRLAIKLLLNAIIIVPLLMWFTEATFWGSLLTAVVLSLIAYVIGDQMILRVSNNAVATIADACLTFIYLWLVAAWADWSLSITELVIISLAVGIIEMVFHRQLGLMDN